MYIYISFIQFEQISHDRQLTESGNAFITVCVSWMKPSMDRKLLEILISYIVAF